MREAMLGLMPPALMLAGIIAYLNSLSGAFVFDDRTWILQNPEIRSLSNWAELVSDTSRPILKLSLAVNYSLGGLQPRGYHLLNLWIHVLASLALFGIVRRTLSIGPLRRRYVESAPWLAFAIALIWLLHPLQTQAVTYVIQRGESLMGLFFLATLYCAIRCAEAEAGSWGERGWALAAMLACSLGMATKEVMVVAPVVVLLYDRTFLASSLGESLRRRWALHLGLAAGWVVMFGVIGIDTVFAGDMARPDLETASPLEYALTQPGVICHYLRLAFWPHSLCFDYGWAVAESPGEILPAGLAVAALAVGSAYGLWRGSWLGFLGASFFLILAPTSSINPIVDMAVEHRMYLPLAPVAVLVVVAGYELLGGLGRHRPWIALSLLALAASLLAFGTVRRNRDYGTPRRLWQSVVGVRPENARAHYNLGTELKQEGEYELAIVHLRRAVSLNPTTEAHNNLANALQESGALDEAIEHYRKAVELQPRNLRVYFNLARTYHKKGLLDEAVTLYRTFLSVTSGAAAGGKVRLPQLRLEAMEHLERALEEKSRARSATGDGGR